MAEHEPSGKQKPERGLRKEPRLSSPDDLYQALIELHRGLDDEQSRVVNARLILLLANHIGDQDVVREAISIAGSSQ